jgi:hypothetical protein
MGKLEEKRGPAMTTRRYKHMVNVVNKLVSGKAAIYAHISLISSYIV